MNIEEKQYNGKSKLLQGILIGAIAGAAISMLDQQARATTMECGKKSYQKVRHIVENPEIVINKVNDTRNQVKSSFNSIKEDVLSISDQINALMEISPQVASVVKESKEAILEVTQSSEK